MIIDDEQRRMHSLRSMRTMLLALACVFGVLITAPIWALSLPSLLFLRFDVGFFVIAHGIVAAFIAIVYWFITAQDNADRTFNVASHS
ncbi:MAG: DUF4212 domain-containing protein [Hyphomicrobiales bacterium]|nr:DUF4212 domain-containing protein [Hyphomicrobiales bacterium]